MICEDAIFHITITHQVLIDRRHSIQGDILQALSAKHGRIFSDQFQICIIVPPMDKVKVAPELANNFPNG